MRQPHVVGASTALLALAIALNGCGSSTVSAPVADPATVVEQSQLDGVVGADSVGTVVAASMGFDGLLKCEPVPAETASADIGPKGGKINIGRHKLHIPAGALARTVTITASILGDSTASLEFGPAGLTFPATARPWIELSYDKCTVPNGKVPRRVAYTTPDLQLLSVLSSFDNSGKKKVYAPLEHFSRYAVAW